YDGVSGSLPAPHALSTLSLHDALPIFPAYRLLSVRTGAMLPRRLDVPLVGREAEMAVLRQGLRAVVTERAARLVTVVAQAGVGKDRKSTRLNSSHQIISYAVFCLKK